MRGARSHLLAGVYTDKETGKSYLVGGHETKFPGQKLKRYVYNSPGELGESVVEFGEEREMVRVDDGWKRKVEVEGRGGSKERF